MQKAYELNIDGLVGPTHNYAGLAFGNLASGANRLAVSSPKAAALQGLEKMRLLAGLGLEQAVCPPQERPDVVALRRLGFAGGDAEVVARAGREAPEALAACSSASGMWMANAATVCPGADAADGRVHFTPANLVTQFHRSLEPEMTGRLLKAIFPEGALFAHHSPLPGGAQFGDEGAANHTRLCAAHHERGAHVFVYGRKAFGEGRRGPAKFPARQSLEASMAIARLHGLAEGQAVFIRQNPELIDAGVFHNDVIAVGNERVFFYHALAFAEGERAIEAIRRAFGACCSGEPVFIAVPPERVSAEEAVRTYLFNSQLVTLPDGEMALVAPVECQESGRVRDLIAELVAGENPVREVHYVDTRQSMRNGGGPACLRLRVVLTDAELAGMHRGVLLTDALYGALTAWVERHYRDRLAAADLADPKLLAEGRAALDELTEILGLGSVYGFQSAGR